MRPEKTTIVEDLSARLNASPFLIVTEYTGMSVLQFAELRNRLAGAGAQCKVVMMLKRSCAALAIDGHKPCGPHGYASARRLGQAQNVALQSCYKYGGKDCVIRAWVCDSKG